MLEGFDTENRAAATGAALVHAVWKSRTPGRLKVTMDLWAKVERFVKTSSKRSTSLAEFTERLKPRLGCESLRPLVLEDGTRRFPIDLMERPLAPPEQVIRTLYRETALCVLLVRDRLEREKAAREDEAGAEANEEDMTGIPADVGASEDAD